MPAADLLEARMRQLARPPTDLAKAATPLRQPRFSAKALFRERFERTLRTEVYQPGQLVLLRNSAIEKSVSAAAKMAQQYLGPYVVARRNKGGECILQELNGATLAGGEAPRRLLPEAGRDDGQGSGGGVLSNATPNPTHLAVCTYIERSRGSASYSTTHLALMSFESCNPGTHPSAVPLSLASPQCEGGERGAAHPAAPSAYFPSSPVVPPRSPSAFRSHVDTFTRLAQRNVRHNAAPRAGPSPWHRAALERNMENVPEVAPTETEDLSAYADLFTLSPSSSSRATPAYQGYEMSAPGPDLPANHLSAHRQSSYPLPSVDDSFGIVEAYAERPHALAYVPPPPGAIYDDEFSGRVLPPAEGEGDVYVLYDLGAKVPADGHVGAFNLYALYPSSPRERYHYFRSGTTVLARVWGEPEEGSETPLEFVEALEVRPAGRWLRTMAYFRGRRAVVQIPPTACALISRELVWQLYENHLLAERSQLGSSTKEAYLRAQEAARALTVWNVCRLVVTRRAPVAEIPVPSELEFNIVRTLTMATLPGPQLE
ncbi:uncharacterized protein SCHCODRAFT_02723502 [Schizophyllum commune H4-8]|nr:uncharacterized protein SCHCODRAFT_02723502 [Schizophyllum commune H4-8]KAI5895926.1 hypothetical protein SCHCODRAFT_02723502 [Schizophyllum commune H4-8]